MGRSRILVVEDVEKTAALVRLYLEHDGFEVESVRDGKSALERALAIPFDLIVLDLMLPGLDGKAICRRLRAIGSVPIVMLTARTSEEDKLAGLDLGADDYVTKPFSPRELVARVRAVLRRSGERAQEGAHTDEIAERAALRFGKLEIDPRAHEVRLRGEPVPLTPREFRLLETLARAPGRAFTRPELVEKAFGHNFEGFDRTVDAHIKNLRRKIEDDPVSPVYVETVPGVGYRFSKARVRRS